MITQKGFKHTEGFKILGGLDNLCRKSICHTIIDIRLAFYIE